MGGHFAEVQGFDKEIALAVSEHYQPTGNLTAKLQRNHLVLL